MNTKVALILVCAVLMTNIFSGEGIQPVSHESADSDSDIIEEDQPMHEVVQITPNYDEWNRVKLRFRVDPQTQHTQNELPPQIEDTSLTVSEDTNLAVIPVFNFPEDLSEVIGFNGLDSFFNLNEEQEALLRANGFVGIKDFGRYNNFPDAYKALYKSYDPIFVTTDSILHTYHIFFDELLRSIEEDYLIQYSEDMTLAMLIKSIQQYENVTTELSDMAMNTVAYFSVALKLIDPNASIPSYVEDVVEQELALIKNHTGFRNSPIFEYKEDSSVFG